MKLNLIKLRTSQERFNIYIYVCMYVKRLIASKIKVFVYIIYVCTVYIYYAYINTHTHTVYGLKIFTCIYIYIFIFLYFRLYILFQSMFILFQVNILF